MCVEWFSLVCVQTGTCEYEHWEGHCGHSHECHARGLVVEYSPATGETRVRFPAGVAIHVFFLRRGTLLFDTTQKNNIHNVLDQF